VGSAAPAPDAAPPGLLGFQQKRKEDSRDRLLSAAANAFCAQGYFPVSVEDIASAAGVSRMTFYRHFAGKAAIAAELFRRNSGAEMPHLLAIREQDWRDRAIVVEWLVGQFASDRAQRQLLRVFRQANVDEPDFTQAGHRFIADVITGLGEAIPAFAADPEAPQERRRWVEAWLLLYEIFDQANHAARDSGIAADPLIIEILADRFIRFVDEAR
jgi:AcrR family transcriptional regulator